MRKSSQVSSTEHPKVICIALSALLVAASLGLYSCDAWGDIANPVDPQSPNYQGYPTVTSPEAIYPYAPAGGAQSFYVPTLVASEVVGATLYQFEIDDVAISPANSTHLYLPAAWRPAAGTHTWRVRASSDGAGYGPWSAPAVFEMSPSGLSGLTPADTALITSISPPVFEWDDVVGADRYQIQISSTASFASTLVNNDNLTSSRFEAPVSSWYTNTGITYYWRIAARNGASGLWSTYSYPRSVRITPLNVTIGSPQPTYANNAQMVTFPVTYIAASEITLNEDDIMINSTGATVARQYITIGGSGNSRTVSLSNLSGNGPLGITIRQGSAVDGNGNIAPSAGPSATFVVDNTAPAFTDVSLSSSSGTNFARNGSVITLAFTVVESGSGINGTPSVTIGGRSATLSGSFPNYSASATLSTLHPEGALSYSISATDRAANAGTTGTVTSSIIFDRTLPEITVGTITSSRAAPYASYAANGDTVTVNFTVTESGGSGLSDITATIGGQIASIVNNHPNYSARLTLSGTAITDGITLGYSISVADRSGNGDSSSGSTNITYDRSGPTISTFSRVSSSPTNSRAATVEVFASDPRGVTNYEILTGSGVSTSGSSTTAGQIGFTLATGDGAKPVTLRVTDALGNTTDQTLSSAIVLDQTPPVITGFSLPGAVNNRNLSAVIGSAITANDATSGVDRYEIGGSGVLSGDSASTGTLAFTLTEAINATKTVVLTVYDNAENYTQSSVNVFYDTLQPAISAITATTSGNTGWVRVGQSITLNFAASGTGSAIAGLPTATIAGRSVSSTFIGGSLYRAVYTMDGTESEGDVYYTISATDAAGNSYTTSPPANSNINFDKSAPSFTISDPNDPLVKEGDSVTYTITYSDLNASITLSASDISLIRPDSANGIISTPTIIGPLVRQVTISNISGNGTLGIQVAAGTATDQAGNTAGARASSIFTVDSIAPVISASPVPTATSDTQTSLTFSFTEAVGVYELRYWIGTGGEPSSGYTTVIMNGATTGSRTFYVNVTPSDLAFSFRLIDNAGNSGPIRRFTYSGGAWVFN